MDARHLRNVKCARVIAMAMEIACPDLSAFREVWGSIHSKIAKVNHTVMRITVLLIGPYSPMFMDRTLGTAAPVLRPAHSARAIVIMMMIVHLVSIARKDRTLLESQAAV